MGGAMITVEGKSKKDCARKLGSKLNEAHQMGLRKEGETLYTKKDGKLLAMCVVHS